MVVPVLSGVAQEKNPHVVVHTQLGDIEMELDAVHAPATTANFLRYVKGGFYTGGLFHRTVTMQNQPDSPVKIEVIQAWDQSGAEEGWLPCYCAGADERDRAEACRWGGFDGAGWAGFGYFGFLYLYWGSAGAGFWWEEECGWAGVCRVWAGCERDGCGAEDSGVSGGGPEAGASGGDFGGGVGGWEVMW